MAPRPAKRARKSLEPDATTTPSAASDGARDGMEEEEKAMTPQSVSRDVTKFKIRFPLWEKKRKRSSVGPNLDQCKREVPPGFSDGDNVVFRIMPRDEWKGMRRYRKFTSKSPTASEPHHVAQLDANSLSIQSTIKLLTSAKRS
jgi:hypothetical protein